MSAFFALAALRLARLIGGMATKVGKMNISGLLRCFKRIVGFRTAEMKTEMAVSTNLKMNSSFIAATRL